MVCNYSFCLLRACHHSFGLMSANPLACRGSVYRALSLMVAASPCALAVAPLAYATAISSCARKVYIEIDAIIKNLNSNVVLMIRHVFLVCFCSYIASLNCLDSHSV